MSFLWLLILSYSLFTCFLSLLILSCFFMCFLPLWLCMVSTCITFSKSDFIFIALHEGVMSFLPYIGLGLPNPFAFFSLHLFTTLGWACWPFCFLFSLFFHHIGLGPLTLLLLFFSSFILFCLTYWANTHFTHQEGPPITHLYSQHYSSPKKDLWSYLWALFFILKILFFFRPSLGPYLCTLFSLGL